MDDLSGLDWNSTSAPAKAPTPPQGNYYATFRPTPPISGRSTPSITQASSSSKSQAKSPLPSKPSTPANDSFANLVSFGGNQMSKNESLQEKQRALQEQKRKQILGDQSAIGSTFGIPDAGRWYQNGGVADSMSTAKSPLVYSGSNEYGGLSAAINKSFTAVTQTSSSYGKKTLPTRASASRDDDDLLAAFAADAPVDSSSNYPKPIGVVELETNKGSEDDDPFGLGLPSQKTEAIQNTQNGVSTDDDVLGLLGRPVSELPARRPETLEIPSPIEEPSEPHPVDKAIAELVDMGFAVDVSRDALKLTSNGLDVQAAVSIILNQAHDRSRQQTRSSTPKVQTDSSRPRPLRKVSADASSSMPTWMRQQNSSASTPNREDNRSPALNDKEPAKYAAELGNTLFKTANSLWKTSTKKLNQAVSEFGSDSDTSQPKWMRDASPKPGPNRPARVAEPLSQTTMNGRTLEKTPIQGMTDEALLLEARDARPQPRQRTQVPTGADSATATATSVASHKQIPSASQRPTQREPHASRPSQQQIMSGDEQAKLNRQLIEEQSSQAYISPARRKKQATERPAPEVDLLESSKASPPLVRSWPPQAASRQPQVLASSTSKPSSSLRPQPPSRILPAISPSALNTSTSHRHTGATLFKAGNYASATTSYTAALVILPPTHPLSSLILTNRALTHLKTGDPKACIADAESAIAIIGPSKGIGEAVDFGNGEGNKPMTDIWGKAMMRRAEALEQLEKWNEAAVAWRECVEAGVGGSTSMQGRIRCEKASSTNGSASTQKRPAEARKAPSALANASRPASSKPSLRPPSSATRQQSAEAVSRLRALHAAAEKADDEKFALADVVAARIDGWRKGKETNLRALLGSLDTVLWEGSGWKKVGMSELIAPGKVKVNYMKGIAKVHPDKLSQPATTEQVMISGAVFSTLNEAWDRFKQENGL